MTNQPGGQNAPSLERVDRCMHEIRAVQQRLRNLNEETNLEGWSREVHQNYRMALDDLEALEAFLEVVKHDVNREA